ncbi:hypothetical protein GCM10009678_04480 [Actinomadura kijaniata]
MSSAAARCRSAARARRRCASSIGGAASAAGAPADAERAAFRAFRRSRRPGFFPTFSGAAFASGVSRSGLLASSREAGALDPAAGWGVAAC